MQTRPQRGIFGSLSHNDRKTVMFRCEGTLYQFLCLCLGFAAAPYVFIKLLKIPMALLKIQICTVIYLDKMLFTGRKREETTALRDTVILLLQCLGFHKSKNVSSDTSSGDRISGNDSQFKGNDYFHSTEKITINKTDVSGSIRIHRQQF